MTIICYSIVVWHSEANIMTLRTCRNCLTDNNSFQYCTTTAVCCWISHVNALRSRLPEEIKSISHEMTPVCGEDGTSLHFRLWGWGVSEKNTGYICTAGWLCPASKGQPSVNNTGHKVKISNTIAASKPGVVKMLPSCWLPLISSPLLMLE